MNDANSPNDGWDWEQFFQRIHATLDLAEAAQDPPEALTLCEHVLKLLWEARERVRAPNGLMLHAHARALMHRGNATLCGPGGDPFAAIKDFDLAINILITLAESPGCPPAWRVALASAFTCRGRAKAITSGHGPLAAIRDHDEAIHILSALVTEHGDDCPPDWRNSLADVFMERGSAKRDAPGHGPLAAPEDWNEATRIRDALTRGDRPPL